jgi:hypothetical protein
MSVGIRDQGSGVEGRGSRVEGRGSRVEGRGSGPAGAVLFGRPGRLPPIHRLVDRGSRRGRSCACPGRIPPNTGLCNQACVGAGLRACPARVLPISGPSTQARVGATTLGLPLPLPPTLGPSTPARVRAALVPALSPTTPPTVLPPTTRRGAAGCALFPYHPCRGHASNPRWPIATRIYNSHSASRQSMFEHTDPWYNRQRSPSALDYATPQTFERIHSESASVPAKPG